jgi:hypothetical protein
MKGCSAEIEISSYSDLMKLSIETFKFDNAQYLNGSIVYQVSPRFEFAIIALEFPSAYSSFDILISVKLRLYDFVIQSNEKSMRVGLCSFGNILVTADSRSLYKCIPCLSGAFVEFSNESIAFCSKCESGRYSKALAMTCEDCASGYFANEKGQADFCTACSPGTFSNFERSTSCISCAQSRYNSFSGQSYCHSCPFDLITLLPGSSLFENCLCPSGKFGIAGAGPCRTCPNWKGVKCEVNSSIPFVLDGFWRSSEDVSLIQECFPSSACPSIGYSSDNLCALGYSGKRCGSCAENYFRSDRECEKCPEDWISWIILVVIVSVFLIVFAIVFSPAFFSAGRSSNSVHLAVIAVQSLGVISRFMNENGQSKSLDVMLALFDVTNLNFGLFFSPRVRLENLVLVWFYFKDFFDFYNFLYYDWEWLFADKIEESSHFGSVSS